MNSGGLCVDALGDDGTLAATSNPNDDVEVSRFTEAAFRRAQELQFNNQRARFVVGAILGNRGAIAEAFGIPAALIAAGRLYIALPPLYRIDIGKETHWAADDEAREEILATHSGRAVPEITRFKGLGEMMPKVLWDTTLNPKTRRLLRVEVEPSEISSTDKVMDDLMGKDPSARFRFIMEHADQAQEIDV